MDTSDAGRIGGLQVLKNKGKGYFKELSKLGVEKRRQKKIEAKLVLDTPSPR